MPPVFVIKGRRMAKLPCIRPAPESFLREKTSDWYWAVGIITLCVAVISIIFGNVLFGLIVVIGGFILSIFAARRPDLVRFEINKSGILINRRLYPFGTLESFFVEDNIHHEMQSKLLVKSQHLMVPLIVIPLEGVDPKEIRDFLLDHLLEEHHQESLGQKIMEGLGF